MRRCIQQKMYRFLHKQEQSFITRVPAKIKAAQELMDSIAFCTMKPVEGAEGYESYEILSDYGDVPQRWVLIRSQQAWKSEQKTLLKKLLKKIRKRSRGLNPKAGQETIQV